MTNIQNNEPKTYDLEERTLKFAKQIIGLCKSLPKDTINQELVSQMIRSSGSVGANYLEANDSISKKDFVYRLKIARKEAKETHYWLRLVLEANPRLGRPIKPLLQEANELKKILSSIIEKAAR